MQGTRMRQFSSGEIHASLLVHSHELGQEDRPLGIVGERNMWASGSNLAMLRDDDLVNSRRVWCCRSWKGLL
jgi:hypothetical protein